MLTERQKAQLEKLFSIPPRIGSNRSVGPLRKNRTHGMQLSVEKENDTTIKSAHDLEKSIFIPAVNEQIAESNALQPHAQKSSQNGSPNLTNNVDTKLSTRDHEPSDDMDEFSSVEEFNVNEEVGTNRARRRTRGKKRKRNTKDNDKHTKQNASHRHGGRVRPKFEISQPPCKFYQEGRCSKGAECPYPHVGEIKKKADLCKFFLVDACQKGDECAYSHDKSKYPCKFFHVKNNCRDGDKCAYSHQVPMTDEQKELLQNQLAREAAPTTQTEAKEATPSLVNNPFTGNVFGVIEERQEEENPVTIEKQSPVISLGNIFESDIK